MSEEYLQYLWDLHCLPLHQMVLTDGSPFLLQSFGEVNKGEGPDFSNGQIWISGIRWFGNIEIHVKSSDWYLHNHQYDAAYDNVILHVVYEHDREVIVRNRVLPTLELKMVLKSKPYYFQFLARTSQSTIICDRMLHQLDPIYLEAMKEKVILQRLSRKAKDVLNNTGNGVDYTQFLYTLIAKAFGRKVNAQPFEELTNRLPLKIVKREPDDYTEILIKGVSGLYQQELESSHDWIFLQKKYDLESMPESNWQTKGLRPSGFPQERITQFSTLIQQFDFETLFVKMSAKEILIFLNQQLHLKQDLSLKRKVMISTEMKNHLLINCFVPFLWGLGMNSNSESIFEKGVDLLTLLPAEKNQALQNWKHLGVKIKNAYDSQALLEIYSQFCLEKKCLFCTVGNKLLRK